MFNDITYDKLTAITEKEKHYRHKIGHTIKDNIIISILLDQKKLTVTMIFTMSTLINQYLEYTKVILWSV